MAALRSAISSPATCVSSCALAVHPACRKSAAWYTSRVSSLDRPIARASATATRQRRSAVSGGKPIPASAARAIGARQLGARRMVSAPTQPTVSGREAWAGAGASSAAHASGAGAPAQRRVRGDVGEDRQGRRRIVSRRSPCRSDATATEAT